MCSEEVAVMGLFLVPAVLLAVVVVFATRRPGVSRSRYLRRAGFVMMAVFGGFAALFVAGETFGDPGGWEAAGLVALWAVPLVAFGLLAYFRPNWAVRPLMGFVAVLIGVSVWFAIDPEGWRSFEDDHGPVRAIATFAVTAVVAVLGLRRTAVAGWLLLAVTVVPVLVSVVGARERGGFAALSLVSSVPVVTGVLYLWSAATARETMPPSTGAGRHDEPKAA